MTRAAGAVRQSLVLMFVNRCWARFRYPTILLARDSLPVVALRRCPQQQTRPLTIEELISHYLPFCARTVALAIMIVMIRRLLTRTHSIFAYAIAMPCKSAGHHFGTQQTWRGNAARGAERAYQLLCQRRMRMHVRAHRSTASLD